MAGLCPDINRPAHPGPITGLPKLVSEEKSRSWGLMSVGVFRRAPGEMVWSSDYHRISYVLTDICGTKQSDDGPVGEYRLQRGDIAFRPAAPNYGAICPAAGLSRSCKVVRPTTIWSRNWCAAGRPISSRKMPSAIR